MATVGTFNVALVASTSRFITAISKADRTWNNFARNIQRQARQMPKAIQAATPASLAMARVVTRAAAIAGAALTGLGAAGIKMAADLEQSRIAFTTMLGSAEEADRFLRELEIRARRTPFGFTGLQEQARQLLAYGFTADKVLSMIYPIGDAVAAMGGSQETLERIVRALGQMQAKQKLSAEEMRQLTEAGIPAWNMLAEAIGTSVPDAMEKARKGMISVSTAINAILLGMQKKYGGTMREQMNTFLGLWERYKDSMAVIMRGYGEDLIRILGIKNAFRTLTEAVERFADAVSQYGFFGALSRAFPPWVPVVIVAIAGAITGALVPAIASWLIPVLKKLRTSLIATLKPLWPWMVVGAAVATTVYLLARYWGQLPDIARAAWSGVSAVVLYAASLIVRGVGVIISAMAWLIPSLRGAAQAVHGLANSLKAAAGQSLAAARSAVQSSVGAQNAAKSAQKTAQAAQQAAQAQENLGDSMEKAAKSAQDNLQSFDEVHQIQEAMANSPAALDMPTLDMDMPEVPAGGLGGAIGELAQQVEETTGRLAKAWQKAVQIISDWWDRLKQKALETFPWLTDVANLFARAGQWVRDNWDTVGSILEGVAGALALVGAAFLIATNPIAAFVAGAALVAGVAALIISNWETVGPFLKKLWEALSRALISIWSDLVATAKVIWEGLKAWWEVWGDNVLAILGAIWNQIVLTVQTALNLVKNIIGFVLAIIRGDWEAAWNNVKDVATTTWNFLVGTLQNLHTTFVAIWQGIVETVQLAWQLLQSITMAAWTALVGWLNSIWQGILNMAIAIGQAIQTTIATWWENIRANTEAVWTTLSQWLKSTWANIQTTANTMWEAIRDTIAGLVEATRVRIETAWTAIAASLERIWTGIRDTASRIWNGLVDLIRGAINNVIAKINHFLDAISSIKIQIPGIEIPLVGKVGGFSIGLPAIPKIPMLAEGGNIIGSGLVLVGEAGPEILELPRGARVTPLSGGGGDLADEIARAVYQAVIDAMRIAQVTTPAGGGDRTIVLKVGEREIARAVLPGIIEEGQRQGLQLVVRPQGV